MPYQNSRVRMTKATKNAMAPLGKNFFSLGDSMLVVFMFRTNLSVGLRAGDDLQDGTNLIYIRMIIEECQLENNFYEFIWGLFYPLQKILFNHSMV